MERAGYRAARQDKHIVIVITELEGIVTIQRHNPVNTYAMGFIVRDAGLTIEEFKKLL